VTALRSPLLRARGVTAPAALFGLCLIAAIGSAISGRPILDGQALQSMAFQLPEFGLLTIAMALPMIAGGINLAVVATANLSAIAAALLLAGSQGGSLTVVTAVAAAIGVGTLTGAANGLVIAGLRASAVIVTLCAMLVATGLGILLTGGSAVTGLPDGIRAAANATFAGVPAILVLFLVAVAVLGFILARTPFGAELRATGLNEAAARFSGIDTRRIILATYALSGLFSALAGLVMLGRFNSAKAGYGDSYLLATILAAVLGGISPDGGRGGMLGLLAAVFVLQATASTLNILNVDPYLTPLAWGLILLAKRAFDLHARRSR